MTREPEFIASFFTLAGDILPHEPPLVSPTPIADRIDAAARAGFKGMGLHFDDMTAARERHGDARLRAMFADAGLRWIELEALLDWFADGERRVQSDAQRRIALDQARALGAFQIKVVGDITGDHPIDEMTEAFAGLCREAAEDGIRVTIELLPISNLSSIERGRRVVEGAGYANGGLMFDAWHVTRGHIPLPAIATLPSGLCAGIELDDGPAEPAMDDLYQEMIHCRRLPGEGEFDVAGLVSAATAAGYHGPYGVEILSGENRGLSPSEAARRAFEAARMTVAVAARTPSFQRT
jgi:sugar phosphate isomerase/epimerase